MPHKDSELPKRQREAQVRVPRRVSSLGNSPDLAKNAPAARPPPRRTHHLRCGFLK